MGTLEDLMARNHRLEDKQGEMLLDFMAKMCHYAQEHCGDPQVWSMEPHDREQTLQCTSYQVACFLAQNTVNGSGGVESDVILSELTQNVLDKNGMMCQSIGEWKSILQSIVDELGGWK
jgi:hypothetical protein